MLIAVLLMLLSAGAWSLGRGLRTQEPGRLLSGLVLTAMPAAVLFAEVRLETKHYLLLAIAIGAVLAGVGWATGKRKAAD